MMADCFSLPNAAELVTTLRNHAEYCDMPFSWMNEAYEQAADTIEQLMKENEKLKAERDLSLQAHAEVCAKAEADISKLKAERDAAVADISHFCDKCKHLNDACCVGCKWEWRGVQA